MSILRRYSKEEIGRMTKQQFMQVASYDDILHMPFHTFRVAVEIRESTDHDDQVSAFKTQKSMMLELVERTEHFRLDERNIYEECGYSGLRGEDRDIQQLMLKRAKEKDFDILIVDSISRLARNVRELFDIIEDFKEWGIGILVIKGEYWTFNMDYNAIMRIAIEAGLAQAESMQTGLRVRTHMSEIAQKGQLLGGDMFGYRLNKAVDRRDNTLVQEPSEAYVVRMIFELYGTDDPEKMLAANGICSYLITHNLYTYSGNLKWTPPKIVKILDNTKYMGYQLPGKSEVVDTVKKKKVLTHVEPIRDEFDSAGNLVKKGNLVKGNWEPIVSEELWWKCYERRAGRSTKGHIKVNGRNSGLRVSSDAYSRKAFCSCGYSLSREYTHVSKTDQPSQFRYKCRWQIMNKNKELLKAIERTTGVVCQNEAVSEMKLWLTAKYVFNYLFKDGKNAVIKTLELIEKCKQEEKTLEDGTNIGDLEHQLEKLRVRNQNLIAMRADGDIDINEFKDAKATADKRIEELTQLIDLYEADKEKQQKRLFDLEKIKERLDTFIDLKGFKVNEEMIDMFVERIIYRGVQNECDEFLWVMNLSGESVDTSAQYRISGYSKEYSDFLMDDSNFNIVTSMIISLDKCKDYVKNVLKRAFKSKFWRDIVVKVAIQE